MLRQQVDDELPMTLRDLLCALRNVQIAGDGLLLRHDEVDAIRLAVDMVVDPAKLLLQALRREAASAEHAEAARPADRRDHIPAMAKGEEGKFRASQAAK